MRGVPAYLQGFETVAASYAGILEKEFQHTYKGSKRLDIRLPWAGIGEVPAYLQGFETSL